MSFWNELATRIIDRYPRKQKRLFSHTMLTDSFEIPHSPRCFRRAPCLALPPAFPSSDAGTPPEAARVLTEGHSASPHARERPGSLTVEAALVLPLFLFAIINLMSLFLMFQRYGDRLTRLHQTGRELSMAAGAGGWDAKEQDIRLMEMGFVKPLIPVMGFRGSLVVNGCVMHKWIGYDLTGETSGETAAEEMVFITKSGTAYHKSRSCPYLNPAVRAVSREEALSSRNSSGRHYTACGICGGKGETLYITSGGDRYHSTISCSGLKRSIEYVSLEQALSRGKHACTKCASTE